MRKQGRTKIDPGYAMLCCLSLYGVLMTVIRIDKITSSAFLVELLSAEPEMNGGEG